jgi:hypothetical protein
MSGRVAEVKVTTIQVGLLEGNEWSKGNGFHLCARSFIPHVKLELWSLKA